MLERQIVISENSAMEYGIEGAVVLSVLNNLELADYSDTEWTEVEKDLINKELPFLDHAQIRSAMKKLTNLNVLKICPGQTPLDNKFKFRVIREGKDSRGKQSNAKEPISVNWAPGTETIQLIKSRMQFTTLEITLMAQEFLGSCIERSINARQFEGKFIRHCSQARAKNKDSLFARDAGMKSPISMSWTPSTQVVGLLTDRGINREIIDAAVPEFVLYWSERGTSCESWGTKFVNWATSKSNSPAESSGPSPMASDWAPASDIFEILQVEEIDKVFTESLIPEFKLYWRDSGMLKSSWSITFLQHARLKWADRGLLTKDTLFSADAFSTEWALASFDDITTQGVADEEDVVSTQ